MFRPLLPLCLCFLSFSLSLSPSLSLSFLSPSLSLSFLSSSKSLSLQSSPVLLADSFFQTMIFPRPFLDPTKRGIERACDDHGYIAATKDEWSFDQFQSLMNQSKEDQKLKELLLQDNLVVFLHLLCCDSNGHAHRPFSSIYLNNVVVVDSVAEGVYNLLEDYYEDIRTAYVFTADHGMHDKGSHGDGHPSNTDTPLVVWGAGFKHPKPVSNHSDCSFRFVDDHMHDAPTPKEWGLHGIERVDVNQADIAPLMVVTICFPDFFPLKLPFKFYHPYLLIEFSGTQLFSVCLVL